MDNLYMPASAIDGLTLRTQELTTITFSLGADECGRLYLEDGQLRFKGNVDESAKVLFEQVCRWFNEPLKDKGE